ncbi:hypothetical protein QR680_000427 [Steinernema hermaphroditum]|uniref:Uncharacterized protein n=1 Tax=Steinernema hermaphroditum TaxID=289476 RepID=A0AA39LE59_9BILA|nr:hypothetical protein QR680_000427 [Steinernema hermaphroditum]
MEPDLPNVNVKLPDPPMYIDGRQKSFIVLANSEVELMKVMIRFRDMGQSPTLAEVAKHFFKDAMLSTSDAIIATIEEFSDHFQDFTDVENPVKEKAKNLTKYRVIYHTKGAFPIYRAGVPIRDGIVAPVSSGTRSKKR